MVLRNAEDRFNNAGLDEKQLLCYFHVIHFIWCQKVKTKAVTLPPTKHYRAGWEFEGWVIKSIHFCERSYLTISAGL